jgi:hypothetical protein
MRFIEQPMPDVINICPWYSFCPKKYYPIIPRD